MKLFLVLSEVNCIDLLRSNGVYPDRFYTDFKAFKRDSKVFQNALVVVIFQGGRHFPKMSVVSFLKGLIARRDGGIRRALIFADENPRIAGGYYHYRDSLFNVDLVDGFDVLERGSDIWGKLVGSEVETEVILSDFDKGDITELAKEYDEAAVENSYRDKIKVVKVERYNGV